MTAYLTAARRLTFNEENWSGESITVDVRDGNRFNLHGYEFRLVDVTEKNQEDQPGDWFYHRQLDIVGEGWDYPLGSVQWFDGRKTKTAIAPGGDLHRDADDPVEAAAKLLAMML